MDVCVFAFTNDRFKEALLHCYKKYINSLMHRGAKVRVISDDECSKFMGADIYQLALEGIPCTTDNN